MSNPFQEFMLNVLSHRSNLDEVAECVFQYARNIDQRSYLIHKISELNKKIFQPVDDNCTLNFQRDESSFNLQMSGFFDLKESESIPRLNRITSSKLKEIVSSTFTKRICELKIEIFKKISDGLNDELVLEYDDVINFENGEYKLKHNYQYNESVIIDSLNQYKEGLESIINYMNKRENILSTIDLQPDDIRQPIIRNLVDDGCLEMSYIVSEKYVTNSISIDDFIKLDTNDINHNNTVYRITDDDLVDTLVNNLSLRRSVNMSYYGMFVKKDKLFYIENLDIHVVKEDYIWGVPIDVLVNEGYKVVNITH